MRLSAARGVQADKRLRLATHPVSIATLLALFTFTVCYFRSFIFPHVPLVPGGDQLDFVFDGSRILAGQLPYRDYFEVVPPGADLTYALLIKLFGLYAGIGWLVMACLAAATVLLMTVVTERLMRGAAIALPGLLFTGFILLESLDATHHWFSTLAAFGAMLILLNGISFPRIASAGALCGLAGCFTQTTGATVVVGFVAYLVWKMRRTDAPAGVRWGKYLLLCGTAVAVFVAANAYFIRAAGLNQWLSCLVIYPLRYYGAPVVNNWRVVRYDFQWSPGAARWIAFPFVYATVPLVYIIFAIIMRRRGEKDRNEPWDQLLLLAITGFAMFLAIASEPSVKRLSTVSPPAMILLTWLLTQPGKIKRRLEAILGTLAVAVAIAVPVHNQTRWRAYLDLPAGRTAFPDPTKFSEYRWVLGHTHPGQFFFGMAPMYLPFHLQDPAAIVGFDASEYTRPKQVVALVRALENHSVPLMILPSSKKYPLVTGSPSDHLAPFQDFLHKNYRRARTFRSGDEVWERIDSVAAASPRAPRNTD